MNRPTCSLLATLSFAASVAPSGLRADVTPGLVAPSLRPGVSTTTLAGTGRAGNDDGPGDRATFMLPTVVRYAADGTLYVVDTAGQRIRAISPAGVVTTVAGGGEPTPDGLAVAGAYRDGPAASARFADPTGLALGPDGALATQLPGLLQQGGDAARALRELADFLDRHPEALLRGRREAPR